MILDKLPLELMREVLLGLNKIDFIQTVKCIRRLYYFAKADNILRRRLQNRVADLELCLDDNTACEECGKLVLHLDLDARFRRENDGVQWIYSSFVFRSKDECKCDSIDGETQIEPDLLNHPSSLYDSHLLEGFENRTNFVINNGSLDEAIVNCGKLFNILTKFVIVRKFELHLDSDQMWEQMSAFFNANSPDMRIQPHATIDSRINLDSFRIFPNGLAGIEITKNFGPILMANPYHEVLRRTPNVSFSGMNLPYTYEDVFGFFKDTKKLSFHSETRITEEQICQIVQNFYEVKQNERILEIQFDEDFLVKDFLTLIPKEAYRLHMTTIMVGPKRKWVTWVEMTDRFGRKWSVMNIPVNDDQEMTENILRIYNMKTFD